MRKPKHLVAFAADRVCKGCLTRYSPPTPLWGGVVFLISTGIFGLLGFFLIGLLFGPSLLGLACEGVFCVFALVVFIRGIRLLIDAAKQVESKPQA